MLANSFLAAVSTNWCLLQAIFTCPLQSCQTDCWLLKESTKPCSWAQNSSSVLLSSESLLQLVQIHSVREKIKGCSQMFCRVNNWNWVWDEPGKWCFALAARCMEETVPWKGRSRKVCHWLWWIPILLLLKLLGILPLSSVWARKDLRWGWMTLSLLEWSLLLIYGPASIETEPVLAFLGS